MSPQAATASATSTDPRATRIFGLISETRITYSNIKVAYMEIKLRAKITNRDLETALKGIGDGYRTTTCDSWWVITNIDKSKER